MAEFVARLVVESRDTPDDLQNALLALTFDDGFSSQPS
jgi:hypothetical protein